VLGKVDQSVSIEPFIIALFYGDSKPSNLEFLKDFVTECKLLENEGVFTDKLYSFRISKILADAPARSFIKACKSHNSYHACEKCLEEGEWSGRIIYQLGNFPSRDDASFLNQTDRLHHTGITLLSELKIGLVSQVPLDYLHLVCLGICRKLIRQWVKGKIPYRLRSRDTIMIGDRLEQLIKFFPSDFQRKPRAIKHVDHFKGTEFRTMLLYTGVTTFRGIIPQNEYKCFLKFHTALYILLSAKADHPDWNGLAKNLLKQFVNECITLYGQEFAVYNLHGLLHINEDAMLFGSLDNASTFPFESFMQKIKSLVHSHNYHLEQVAKQIIETERFQDDIGSKYRETKNAWPPNNICKTGDNCYMLNTGKVIVFKKAVNKEKNIYLCQTFGVLNPLKYYPIDSSKLGIFVAKSLSEEMVVCVEEKDILFKYIRLPYKGFFVCIPLLHSRNKCSHFLTSQQSFDF